MAVSTQGRGQKLACPNPVRVEMSVRSVPRAAASIGVVILPGAEGSAMKALSDCAAL